jgi:phage gpG-like protein
MAEIVGLEQVIGRVRELRERAANPAAPLKASADYMLASVDQNFAAGGRPERWEPHSEATRARLVGPQRLLERSGTLRSGFRPTLGPRGWSIGNEPARAYWPRQQFGYEGGGGRGQSRTPARPFLLYQPEDTGAVAATFADYFFRP